MVMIMMMMMKKNNNEKQQQQIFTYQHSFPISTRSCCHGNKELVNVKDSHKIVVMETLETVKNRYLLVVERYDIFTSRLSSVDFCKKTQACDLALSFMCMKYHDCYRTTLQKKTTKESCIVLPVVQLFIDKQIWRDLTLDAKKLGLRRRLLYSL